MPLLRSFVEELKPLIESQHLYFENLTILNASDCIYQHHVHDILSICPAFWNNFGQTESGPRIFTLQINHRIMNQSALYSQSGVVALGKPVDPTIHIAILNEEGKECDTPEIGELYYQSPFRMEGYLDTDGSLISKNQIASGDLVYRNEDGNVCWVGRKNEIVKINGKYMNIGLLHQYFDSVDGVKKSYFIYDDKKGLFGFFVMDNLHSENDIKDKIISLYKQRFPTYPRICRLIAVEEIPSTLSGKTKYSSLRNMDFSLLGMAYV